MFKDFHRRLQRDVKKIVDARVLASDGRVSDAIKVKSFSFVLSSFAKEKTSVISMKDYL